MKQRELPVTVLATLPEICPSKRRNSRAISAAPQADFPLSVSQERQESSPGATTTPVATPRKEHLNPTEMRILSILADPESEVESNTEIAKALGTTPGAVKQHLHRMYVFYGVKSIRGLFRLSFGAWLTLRKGK